ncbi:MAG: hypothetical protein A3H98_03230 [Bacteroidetes bacterium RIFCSPLOWO2_02_FULL_36_8]|nr:MAG: hypothetical protein A3H98_03230 [Bacteroidetes bacterium RIFCSPLOWO2_02_FULL_36_8]OFY70366.1 MAG: hypothetical protein A3G23_09560 [Bacteroidetes bacterium RIFCSPLOWO2_12_FULL_37_12]
MTPEPVISFAQIKEFLALPVYLYKNDPNWIHPLDKDIEDVFDKNKNKFFRHGEICRWILRNEHGKATGRVAAFINNKTANTFDQPTGGMGFFECINDKNAAFILFDLCKNWLTERGMKAMDGPINFGERDRWWGLLTEGYAPPTYRMNYNPAYYKEFFEAYGFKPYFEQYIYEMKVAQKLPEKYAEKAQRIANDPGYTFSHLKLKELNKAIDDFRIIYNKAWVRHDNFKAMSETQARSIIYSFKPIIEEDLLWFSYYKGDPVGFFLMLPEINQIFRYFSGKLNTWNKLRFLWHRWRKTCNKIFGAAFGIVPEHQHKGLEGAIIMAAANVLQHTNRYDKIEITWIGDFNPKMLHLLDSLGATRIKTMITYRKLFDEAAVFKRAPVIG